MQQRAVLIGAITPDERANERRLRSVAYNLDAEIVIGGIVIMGTLFETLQILVRPRRWRELPTRGRGPKLALHEWDLDGDTEDIS